MSRTEKWLSRNPISAERLIISSISSIDQSKLKLYSSDHKFVTKCKMHLEVWIEFLPCQLIHYGWLIGRLEALDNHRNLDLRQPAGPLRPARVESELENESRSPAISAR